MSVIFSASEVGSARALIPLFGYCTKQGMQFLVIRRGYFAISQVCDEYPSLASCPREDEEIVAWLVDVGASLVVFSVNVKDQHPLKVARAASLLGLPTIHVLDYWNGYSSRMNLDGLGTFVPTIYTVPDEYAANKARLEGIDSQIISVTGQPAFYDLLESFQHAGDIPREHLAKKLGLPVDNEWVLFVAEPVAADQGRSLSENSNFRGYVEEDALSILIKALELARRKISVCVLPHPRQDIEQLQGVWSKLGGEPYGRVISGIRGRELLPFVVGTAGMASTLLYESWVTGVPVASIQPGLLTDSMRMLKGRDNVTFVDRREGAIEVVKKWIVNLSIDTKNREFLDDILMHQIAPENIYRLVTRSINDARAKKETTKVDLL